MSRLTLALLAAALLVPAVSLAGTADETALAERYAPVLRLVEQTHECGRGEPYEPINVNALFGEPTVALRGPWNPSDLVKIGPTADDLSRGLYEYHLDFPGSALQPGCDYERWARRITAGRPPTMYAHVARQADHPDRLALQYWFFYVYNDWNNLHEGDWEMIQLDFDAAGARQALATAPAKVGYSQHEGAEEADWGTDKLQLVGGTHPVVYAAAGSHANFFGDALFLGRSAEQGVGCDDTTGPHVSLRPAVLTIPTASAQARTEFPWIAFEGRWGELQPAFFNGPTGPNLKQQWTHPITWSEGWRTRSFEVPAGSVFGHSATDFFCLAIGSGSRALVRIVSRPLLTSVLLALIALALLAALARTSWRPTAPLRLARRRAWGQTLTASSRMYGAHLPLFVGMGVLFVPVSLLIALLQAAVLHGTSILGVQTGGDSGGVLAFVVLAVSTSLTLLGLGLLLAATTRAMAEIDQRRTVGPLRAYWLARDAIRPLLGALLISVTAVSLLATSIYLLPVAVWLAGRWALIAPAIELEEVSAIGGLRRSGRLARGRWLKVTSLIVVGAALALVAGPLIGVLLIVSTSAPFWLVNVVAGLVYALTMPFVAITAVYVYFDRRVASDLAGDVPPAELPAEIEVTGWSHAG